MQVLDEGCVSTHSHFVTDFEKAMCDYLGVPDCIATHSGTAALHLALMECGIGSGDEVVIPALTFVATRNAIKYVGAKPIIVDVNPKTWLLNNYIGFGLILPVDLYGNPSPGFAQIYDAAESLGARKHHPHYVCYSFNGNKTMTTGGGGLLVGKDLDHIRTKLNPGHYNGIGYNYRMTGLAASLGLAQLKRLPYFLKKKRQFNEIYRNELNGLVKFQEATPGSEPSWWMTACTFPEHIDISILQKQLNARGVPTGRIFKPLADLPNAKYIYEHGLCLPSSTLNSDLDVKKTCIEIKSFL